ncbi:hypothetical protein DN069_04525 [Streptacidiphilus pinicola]|uniref:Uncharacterized protein n=1 Tax=Streptacidiphilus pinicola TaxID=2219663 RepID=A0A2X0J939_9ACTN|nr:hypothetical protein [Streptacidiphilus pinicola]RAG86806.1 hypothetical protein DN069_04525 [Streptacidiphilus pinicola]
MDLSFLRPLYARPGPFACAYLDVSEDGGRSRSGPAGWEQVRERLVAEGADVATVGALAHAVSPGDGPIATSPGLAVFAAHGRLALAESLHERPEHDRATVTFVPDAMPLALQHAPDIAFAAVQVRRVQEPGGASQLVAEVQIGRWPAARVTPPEPHMRQAAAGEWRQEAVALAAELTAAEDRHGIELVVLSGDRWGCSVLRAALPGRLDERVVGLDIEPRAVGAGGLLFEEELGYLFDGRLSARDKHHVERFLTERARQGEAVEGLTATAGALREGAVAVLLVDTPQDLDRERLWVGAATRQLGVSQEVLAPLQAEASWQVPAGAAVLRALVGEGGELVAVPREELPLADGVGALLRERPRERAA